MHFLWQNASNWCNLSLKVFLGGGGVSKSCPSFMAITRLRIPLGISRDFPVLHVSPISVSSPATRCANAANSVASNFGFFRRQILTLKFHMILIFNSYRDLMNCLLLGVCCLCDAMSFVCWVRKLRVGFSYGQLASWLSTLINSTIIKTIIQNSKSWNKMYSKIKLCRYVTVHILRSRETEKKLLPTL